MIGTNTFRDTLLNGKSEKVDVLKTALGIPFIFFKMHLLKWQRIGHCIKKPECEITAPRLKEHTKVGI